MIQEWTQPTGTSIETELECLTYSAYLLGSTKEMDTDPIFLLDSTPRTAFLLHHVLGHTMEDAALLLQVSEIEFRAQLRNAYLQLASCKFAPDVYLNEVQSEPALA
jgi:hypothetical protein